MSRVSMLMLKDGLSFSSGFVSEATYLCLIYCRVPDDWIQGEIAESSEMWLKGITLQADKLEKVYGALYGDNWRNGNEDGSHYVVVSVGTWLLNPHETDHPWEMDDPNDKRFHYFYFVENEFAPNEDGNFKSVNREEF